MGQRYARWFLLLLFLVCIVLVGGCAGAPKNPAMKSRCDRDLAAAYKELKKAKGEGFDGSVNLTKAASLLGAAKVQQGFEKYPNCVDKVKRARYYIKESRKK